MLILKAVTLLGQPLWDIGVVRAANDAARADGALDLARALRVACGSSGSRWP